MEKKESSRRKFIRMGVILGTGAAVGKGILSARSEEVESGEKMKVLTSDGKVVEVDKAHVKENHCCDDAREGIPNKKMVMVVDLAKCRNARKCLEGCQKMHLLPSHIEWIKIYLMRDSKDTAPYWFPKPCLHCNNPPCVKVCPVGATFKRTDSIVLIDNERCIGCKFCMAACPYASRVFYWNEPNVDPEKITEPYSPENSTPGKVGTVSKCDFCPDMVRKGKLPACVTSCPNGVIYYGDKNLDTVTNGSETLRFSELVHDRAAYRFMEELGTEPNLYYLPPSNRLFDYESGFQGLSEEEIELYKKEAQIKD